MKKIANIITNKYLVASVFFVVWMLFFDQRDYFQLKERQAEFRNWKPRKNIMCRR
jgi:cell division protein DivIC